MFDHVDSWSTGPVGCLHTKKNYRQVGGLGDL